MTVTTLTGASSAPIDWEGLDWTKASEQVKRLQMRIAKATREGRYGKVKALQRLLTCSFYSKAMAVKRVTDNKGSKTPGVDGVVWNTSKKKTEAVSTLRRHGYKPQPLRRIYIPKKNGKLRPLSIPTMKCRAMQALHLLALEPVSETLADENSYGFRPLRSTADAIQQCFVLLSQRTSAQWVLEGDIKSCFDKINHAWLENNVPMDKTILHSWLKAGYVEDGSFFTTKEGTPQGGIISPTLLVMTLRGLEKRIKEIYSSSNRVRIVIYADDFVVTGATKEVLENEVKPIIKKFLKERGLELSEEKTRITHINDGFDFLGFNLRKYNNKLLIKPSKQSVKTFLNNIRGVIKARKSVEAKVLIRILNPKIRGWANYYKSVVAKDTFSYVDHCTFQVIWSWAKRRHRNKTRSWIKKKYFRNRNLRQWVFSVRTKSKKKNDLEYLDLFHAASVPIKRHVKIRAAAQPYDPAYQDYFVKRAQKKVAGPSKIGLTGA